MCCRLDRPNPYGQSSTDPFYEMPLRPRQTYYSSPGTVVYHPFFYLLSLVKSYLHAWFYAHQPYRRRSFFGSFLCRGAGQVSFDSCLACLLGTRIIQPVDAPEAPFTRRSEDNNCYLDCADVIHMHFVSAHATGLRLKDWRPENMWMTSRRERKTRNQREFSETHMDDVATYKKKKIKGKTNLL